MLAPCLRSVHPSGSWAGSRRAHSALSPRELAQAHLLSPQADRRARVERAIPILFPTRDFAQEHIFCPHRQIGGLASSALFLPATSHKRIFFLGPRHSGAFFHAHSHALNALAHGRKRWLLLPPGAAYGAQGRTTLEWLRTPRRPGTDEEEFLSPPPLECTQAAGQALFVPSGWNHATLNLAWSVGIAVEVGDQAMIEAASAIRS